MMDESYQYSIQIICSFNQSIQDSKYTNINVPHELFVPNIRSDIQYKYHQY